MGNGELGMGNWEWGIGNVEKVYQQKGVSTEIEKKTFFTHRTCNFDLSFLQFSQFGIVSVESW